MNETKFDPNEFDRALKRLMPDWRPEDTPERELRNFRRKRRQHLGVGRDYPYEKNLRIVREKYQKNPYLTLQQVNYLSRFSWVGHQKGRNYNTGCRCLRCRLLHDLKG